ncbi:MULTISPECIES: hypothetical protein [Streptomyces]|uniref:hypothetical protein n=1 Tax=Streptomyces TaxID=1883 RepID=UPI00345C22EB
MVIKEFVEVLFSGVGIQTSGIWPSLDELVVEVASTGWPGWCPDSGRNPNGCRTPRFAAGLRGIPVPSLAL